MKQIATLLLILAASCTAFAGQKLKFKGTNPNWLNASAWDPARLPANGDTVFIPAGTELLINSNLDLESINITIQIAGTLKFVGGGARLRTGAATTYTLFPGSFVDGGGNASQRIVIGGEEIWRASEGDLTGPAYASLTSSRFINPIVLPVIFSFFYAEIKNNAALITWATAREQNAKSFVVERSTDGSNWVSIGSVKAAGHSTTKQNYSFTDGRPLAGKASYRIKQVDLDGRFEYTALRSVNNGRGEAVQIRAVNGQVVLQFAAAQKNVVVQVVTLNGQVITKQLLNNTGSQVVLSSNFKGAVVVAVQDAERTIAARQIML